MSNHPHSGSVRRVLTPLGPSRKGKERNDDGSLSARKGSAQQADKAEPASAPDNRLLAGYLAHEYLTRGTIFGQPWVAAEPAEPAAKQRAYADVARLLKTEGAHIPAVVNPSQLARWLQM